MADLKDDVKAVTGIVGGKLVAAISGITVVGSLGLGWVVLTALEADAQEKIDAGIVIVNATTTAAISPVKAQAEATQQELERFKIEMTAKLVNDEAYKQRQEVKMDKLFERWQIVNPAPRPPDGGTP
jgi:hypothetical protein